MYGFCLIQPQSSQIWTVMTALENTQSVVLVCGFTLDNR